MNIFLAFFLLGIIQGLTEFLPVSSSGHLVLFSKIFGVEESLFLSIILHVATLLSIIVVFRKQIWFMICHPFSQQTLQIVLATIPTCLIVLILLPVIKQSFAGALLPLSFAISAILLIFAEFLTKKNTKVTKQNALNYKTAILMGMAQGFAVFPGISRSGSTISAGLLQGGDKSEVAKFSFLMSIPIILLSMVMEIYDIFSAGVSLQISIWPTIISFFTAFIVGILAIKLMIKITSRAKLQWFSLYLAVIAIVSLFFM